MAFGSLVPGFNPMQTPALQDNSLQAGGMAMLLKALKGSAATQADATGLLGGAKTPQGGLQALIAKLLYGSAATQADVTGAPVSLDPNAYGGSTATMMPPPTDSGFSPMGILGGGR